MKTSLAVHHSYSAPLLPCPTTPCCCFFSAVALSIASAWLLQEWVVHRYLLHSNFAWFGRDVHDAHHAAPYHHVSLDPPMLVAGVMATASVVFWVAFGGSPLALTAMASYFSAGVQYSCAHASAGVLGDRSDIVGTAGHVPTTCRAAVRIPALRRAHALGSSTWLAWCMAACSAASPYAAPHA